MKKDSKPHKVPLDPSNVITTDVILIFPGIRRVDSWYLVRNLTNKQIYKMDTYVLKKEFELVVKDLVKIHTIFIK